MRSIVGILFNTRSTFVKLNDEYMDDLNLRTTVIFLLCGVAGSLKSVISEIEKAPFVSTLWEIAIMLTLSGLLGYALSRFIFTQLLYNVSKFLKGKAEFLDIKVILAYSMIPGLILIPINLYLTSHFNTLHVPSNIWIIKNCLNILSVILSFKILVQGLKEFNEFTTRKAIINASVMFIVPIVVATIFYLPYFLDYFF